MGWGMGVMGRVGWRRNQCPEKVAVVPRETGWGRVRSLKAEEEKETGGPGEWGSGKGGGERGRWLIPRVKQVRGGEVWVQEGYCGHV